jgi:hypothetical protein
MFHAIKQFLRESIDGLESVERWSAYVRNGAARAENDLQHTLETVLLALVVLEALESEPPAFQYDRYDVLACAAVHDLGEIVAGDTLYRQKTRQTEEHERSVMQTHLSRLPGHIAVSILDYYEVQYGRSPRDNFRKGGPRDARRGSQLVFELIERTGYLLYAIGEFERSESNIRLLVQVARNQYEPLLALLELIPAGRRIFPDDILHGLAQVLEEYRGLFLE